MRAIQITGPQRVEVVDVPTPTLADGHIILETERISVCGSDMTRYRGVLPEEEYPFTAGAPCHEAIGIVQESHTAANRIIPVSKNGDPTVQLKAQPFGTVMPASSASLRSSGKT